LGTKEQSLLEVPDIVNEDDADLFEAPWRALVGGVPERMPKGILEIDEDDRRHTGLDKGKVIVDERRALLANEGTDVQKFSRIEYRLDEKRGVGFRKAFH
jgi:hypothetical protein